jgi:hypothetical protein
MIQDRGENTHNQASTAPATALGDRSVHTQIHVTPGCAAQRREARHVALARQGSAQHFEAKWKKEWHGRRGRAQQAEGRFRMNWLGAEGKFQLGLKCGIGRRHAH